MQEQAPARSEGTDSSRASRSYVVTGSASGIGAATRALLAAQGHKVIGVDLRGAEVCADLGTPAGRERAVAEVIDIAGGSLDAAICCAGIADGQGRTISINYFGTVEFLTGLRPVLAQAVAPRAVGVSSVAIVHGSHARLVAACLSGDESAARAIGDALEAKGPGAGYLNYPSSKEALSRWVRREAVTPQWAGSGIALNAVAPGTVLTPLTTGLLGDPATAEMVDAAVPMPLGGHQSPESVAHLLIWLASAENTAVTGRTVFVDGGAEAALRPDSSI